MKMSNDIAFQDFVPCGCLVLERLLAGNGDNLLLHSELNFAVMVLHMHRNCHSPTPWPGSSEENGSVYTDYERMHVFEKISPLLNSEESAKPQKMIALM